MSPLLPPFSPPSSIHQMQAVIISVVSRVAADGRHYSAARPHSQVDSRLLGPSSLVM